MSEMLILDITVPGEPMGKARPRLGRSGHVYTPKNTLEKQQQIAYLAVKNGARMSYLPIRVSVEAFFAVPKSLSKKKQEQLIGAPCAKKPDGDNVLKLVCDALNGISYEDDSSVVSMSITKQWASEGSMNILVYEERLDERA